MTYPGLDTIANSTTDVTQILVYGNTVTNGWLGVLILYGFFIVVLIAGYFAQMRFSGRPKIDTAFLAASFVSVGMAVIMWQEPGVLLFRHVMVMAALTIVSGFWVLAENTD